MTCGYDLFLVMTREEGEEYIFVNQAKGTTPMRSGGRTFNDVVGFPAKIYRGETDVSYPVVYDDHTIGLAHETTRQTSYEALPFSIQQRFRRWSEMQ